MPEWLRLLLNFAGAYVFIAAVIWIFVKWEER